MRIPYAATEGLISHTAERFPLNWLKRGKDRAIDLKLYQFFQDLERWQFWHVLSDMDGGDEQRGWAEKTFASEETEEILSLSIQQAFIARETSFPGNKNGHGILYEHAFKNPHSKLLSHIDETEKEDFKVRLNNLRLWEALPDMDSSLNFGRAYGVAEDVLGTENFLSLTPKFVTQGLNILGMKPYSFNLRGLSDKAVDKYWSFVQMVNSEVAYRGILPEKVGRLVVPYIFVAVSKDEDGNPRFADSERRLSDPLIKSLVKNQESVRQSVLGKSSHLDALLTN